MARVIYNDAEGAERSVRLLEHRPVRIGRDASNDIVLPDPKASRAHAEIVFEKGFFVLHDLESANGTLVAGKRVRVAPLVDATEIRIGTTLLRFDEELEDLPARTVAAHLGPAMESAREAAASRQRPAPARNPGFSSGETLENPSAPAPAQGSHRIPAPAPQPPAPRHGGPAAAPVPPALEAAAGRPSLDNRRLFIDDIDSDPDHMAVRNELDQPLVWFRSPRSAVMVVAKIVATMVVISGLVVALFLVYERAWLPAGTAALITISFALMVGAAIPKRNVPVWTDATRSTLLLIARQESGLSFPTLRFLLHDASGASLGTIEKRIFPAAGRRVWRLFDADGAREIARAYEDSLIRSLIGRVIGGSIRVLRTNYVITTADMRLAVLNRARARPGRLLLEVTAGPRDIDRRLLVALALVIATTER